MPAAPTAAPEKCSAHKTVKFYAGRIAYWRSKMGAGETQRVPGTQGALRGYGNWRANSPAHSCPRHLAHVLQRKAYGLRKVYARYMEYHWHWWKWMDAKWQRVGACETGYGRRPGSFTWDSGTYVSFAGIIRGGYAQFAHRLGLLSWDETVARTGRPPTPRQQVLVATALQAQYGWGAWGCGGA